MSTIKTPYLPDPGLVAAVEVALDLQMPLLVTGEPGTGKTQLAYWVAQQKLAEQAYGGHATEVLRFNTKTTSVAKDLFYRYDAIRHFRDAQRRDNAGTHINPLDYVTFEALGKAILAQGVQRYVVLVDEIDKASRDFPNDVLFEFEEMAFRIEEAAAGDFAEANKRPGFWSDKAGLDSQEIPKVLAEQGVIRWTAPQPKPVLILTSNSEKNLPDAFMRRCVYYHIDFPEKEQLANILEAHFPEKMALAAREHLAARFLQVRNKGLRKLPATAELVRWVEIAEKRKIDWATVEQAEGKTSDARSEAEKSALRTLLATYAVLTKNKDDRDKMMPKV